MVTLPLTDEMKTPSLLPKVVFGPLSLQKAVLTAATLFILAVTLLGWPAQPEAATFELSSGRAIDGEIIHATSSAIMIKAKSGQLLQLSFGDIEVVSVTLATGEVTGTLRGWSGGTYAIAVGDRVLKIRGSKLIAEEATEAAGAQSAESQSEDDQPAAASAAEAPLSDTEPSPVPAASDQETQPADPAPEQVSEAETEPKPTGTQEGEAQTAEPAATPVQVAEASVVAEAEPEPTPPEAPEGEAQTAEPAATPVQVAEASVVAEAESEPTPPEASEEESQTAEPATAPEQVAGTPAAETPKVAEAKTGPGPDKDINTLPLQTELEESEAKRRAVQSSLAEAQLLNQKMAAMMGERATEAAQLRQDLASAQKTIENQSGDVADLRERQELLSQEVAAIKQERSKLVAALEDAQEARQLSERAFAQSKAYVAGLLEETEAYQSRTEKFRIKLQESASALEVMRQMLRKSETEKKALEGEIERLHAEIGRLAAELAAARSEREEAASN